MDWEGVPQEVRDKHETISNFDEGIMNLQLIEAQNQNPIVIPDYCSLSYRVFAHEFNSILLTAHLFENLLMFEDIRNEQMGHNWFQIEIPEEYFRYPGLNNPKDVFSYREIDCDEKKKIQTAVSATKSRMHYSKDENIARENLHKLEFLTIFSYLEAYVENLLSEFLGFSKDEASKKLRYTSLPDVMRETFYKINPQINEILTEVNEGFFRYIQFCYRLRNIHTHNLGKATERFISLCLKERALYEEIGKDENGEEVVTCLRLNFNFSDKIVEQNRYVTLQEITYAFRIFSRECAFIVESCKNQPVEK